jgi:hypothetical protein
VHVLQTAFDRWVPVIPQFIVPYNWLEPVLYGCLLFFFVFHPKIFTAFGAAFIAIESISNGVYIVFQTMVPRPTNLVAGSSKYVDALLYTYSHDNPYNCFPSLHCGLSALAASFWWVKKRYFCGGHSRSDPGPQAARDCGCRREPARRSAVPARLPHLQPEDRVLTNSARAVF